jgi:ankyrin repeat protein
VGGRSPLHHFYNPVLKEIMLRYREEIDPWMRDQRGMTILHWVAWSRRSSHQVLPHSHQNANGLSCLELKDAQGKSMLHYAVQRGNVDLISFFLASPYATTMSMLDLSDRSLLHYATESSQVDTIDLLLDANFKMSAVDAKGRTVLHHAATRDNLLAARRLIQLGAAYQLACEDCDGRTPLELAHCFEAKSVVAYFQSLEQEQYHCPKQKPDNAEIKSASLYVYGIRVVLVIASILSIAIFSSVLL